MGIEQTILVRGTSLRARVATALGLLTALTACGQYGALYMPVNDPDFQQRAKLTDIIRRQLPGAPAATPASAAASTATPGTLSAPIKPVANPPAGAASATGR